MTEAQEKTGGWIERLTYSLGGQTVGVEVKRHPTAANNGRFYLLTNHLGSVTAVVDDDGDLVEDFIRYNPCGDYRGIGS